MNIFGGNIMRTFGFEMEASKLINYLFIWQTDRQRRPEAAQKGLYGWWRAWDGRCADTIVPVSDFFFIFIIIIIFNFPKRDFCIKLANMV
jgi:hypothetical protein